MLLHSLHDYTIFGVVLGIYFVAMVWASVSSYRRKRKRAAATGATPAAGPNAWPLPVNEEFMVITRDKSAHGMYTITHVPTEVLEMIYTGVQEIVQHPELPNENTTSRAYRGLARTVCAKVDEALRK